MHFSCLLWSSRSHNVLDCWFGYCYFLFFFALIALLLFFLLQPPSAVGSNIYILRDVFEIFHGIIRERPMYETASWSTAFKPLKRWYVWDTYFNTFVKPLQINLEACTSLHSYWCAGEKTKAVSLSKYARPWLCNAAFGILLKLKML